MEKIAVVSDSEDDMEKVDGEDGWYGKDSQSLGNSFSLPAISLAGHKTTVIANTTLEKWNKYCVRTTGVQPRETKFYSPFVQPSSTSNVRRSVKYVDITEQRNRDYKKLSEASHRISSLLRSCADSRKRLRRLVETFQQLENGAEEVKEEVKQKDVSVGDGQKSVSLEVQASLKNLFGIQKVTETVEDREFKCDEAEQTMRDLARELDLPIVTLERLKKQYDKYDVDKSGFIERNEFFELLAEFLPELKMVEDVEAVSRRQIERYWTAIDQDQSGELDFAEFASFVVTLPSFSL